MNRHRKSKRKAPAKATSELPTTEKVLGPAGDPERRAARTAAAKAALRAEERPEWADRSYPVSTADVVVQRRRDANLLNGQSPLGVPAVADAIPPPVQPGNQRKKGGRPRMDEERDRVRQLHKLGKSWKQIADEINKATGKDRTPGAYRALLRTDSRRTRASGKNVQN